MRDISGGFSQRVARVCSTQVVLGWACVRGRSPLMHLRRLYIAHVMAAAAACAGSCLLGVFDFCNILTTVARVWHMIDVTLTLTTDVKIQVVQKISSYLRENFGTKNIYFSYLISGVNIRINNYYGYLADQ